MYPFFYLFGRRIPSYSVTLILAAGIAWLALWSITKKKGTYTSDTSLVFLMGIAGGVTGAFALRPLMRIIEMIVKGELDSFDTLLRALSGGEAVFYGGVIGGALAIFLFARSFRISLLPTLDALAPSLALAHALGRIGCLLAGCCYGIEMPMDHPFAIVYPASSPAAPGGTPLLAVPALEAAFLLILCLILTRIYLKTHRPALPVSLYLIAYSLWRFFIEFFRGDLIRGHYGTFSTSQYISIILFFFGLIFLIRSHKFIQAQS